MKKKFRLAIFAALFAAAAAGTWILLVMHSLSAPVGGNNKIVVEIGRGKSMREIADELEAHGVIKSAEYFSYVGKKKGLAAKIQAGEYELSSDMTPDQVLQTITSGKVVTRRFTIPEGFTLDQIARKLDRIGVVSEADFIEAAGNTSISSSWIKPSPKNLEGLLFPETYTYAKSDDAKSIVRMMCAGFERVFGPIWESRNRDIGISRYEAIILASIIERETAANEERAMVAGVFMNRLRMNIRLMSDPTVIYGIPNFNGNLTKADLQTPTPYNTYMNAGLPPGPICSPGAASLRAAVKPAKTDALYFVARGDGKHQFSATLEEHNAAVNKYQRGGD